MDGFDPEAPRRVIGRIGGLFYADEWRGVGKTLRRTRKGPLRPTAEEATRDAYEWALSDWQDRGRPSGEPGFVWPSRPAQPIPDFER